MLNWKILLTAGAVALATAAPAAAEYLRIVNRSGSTITAIWTSASSNNSWENELLRGRRLGNGQYYEMNIRNVIDCNYDLRVQWADGYTAEDYGINICQVDVYTIRP